MQRGSAERESAPAPRRRRLPGDFTLTDERSQYAKAKGLRDPVAEFEKFTDHFRGSGAPKLDWDATWRNWVRNAVAGRYAPTGRRPAPQEPTRTVPDVAATQRRLRAMVAGVGR